MNRIVNRNYSAERIYHLVPDSPTGLQQFEALPVKKRASYQAIQGHFYFGIHKLVPVPSTYMTLFREPVDRVISTYYYILKTPIHRLHQQLVSQRMSLEDFIDSKLALMVDNGQTRLLAGDPGIPFGACTQQTLESAKQHLENYFSAVGLTEKFKESLMIFQKRYGWKNIEQFESLNVNRERVAKTDVPKEVLKKIEELNLLDAELYRIACERFSKEVAGC